MRRTFVSKKPSAAFTQLINEFADFLAHCKEEQAQRHTGKRLRYIFKDPLKDCPLTIADIQNHRIFDLISEEMQYDQHRRTLFAKCIEKTLSVRIVTELDVRQALQQFINRYPRPIPIKKKGQEDD